MKKREQRKKRKKRKIRKMRQLLSLVASRLADGGGGCHLSGMVYSKAATCCSPVMRLAESANLNAVSATMSPASVGARPATRSKAASAVVFAVMRA